MNHIKEIKKFNNIYYVIRHGQSRANIKKLIMSSPKYAVKNYGLSEVGKQQARDSIKANKDLDKETIIYSSDFKRARETAEIVRAHIKAKPIILTKSLRERYFGKYDRTSDKNYDKVWQLDIKDKPLGDIESVYSVADRATKLVLDLEKKYKGKKIVLATHGDIVNILLTCFSKKDPKFHHTLFSLKTAELRKAN